MNEQLNGFPTHKEICQHIRSLGHRDDEEWTTDNHLNNIQFKLNPDFTIADCAAKLQSLPSPLKEEFLHWWKTGEIKSVVEVKGVTVQHIINLKKLDVFLAFYLLGRLYENPDDYILHRMLTHHRGFFE